MLNPRIQGIFHGREALRFVTHIGSTNSACIGKVQADLSDLNTLFFKLTRSNAGQEEQDQKVQEAVGHKVKAERQNYLHLRQGTSQGRLCFHEVRIG